MQLTCNNRGLVFPLPAKVHSSSATALKSVNSVGTNSHFEDTQKIEIISWE